MSETVEVLYKCVCMSSEVALQVPARRGTAHDVVAWLNDVVAVRISADHTTRSPTCLSDAVEFVKIPAPPVDGYVGQAED